MLWCEYKIGDYSNQHLNILNIIIDKQRKYECYVLN